jgi:septal ring factor EnvC (AmiA/AmiB activator)
MPVAGIIFHGEPLLPRRVMITFAALAALLSCVGCIVTTSTYSAKVREVDALRDAYASSNRETSRLASEVEALSKQVAGQEAALQELSSRADACEAGRTREKRESADRDRELAEFLKKTGTKEEPAARSAAE